MVDCVQCGAVRSAAHLSTFWFAAPYLCFAPLSSYGSLDSLRLVDVSTACGGQGLGLDARGTAK